MNGWPRLPVRRRRKDARPRELLAAALELFVDRGVAGAPVDAIAERARVSKGTLYLYFDGKAALFDRLIAERFYCHWPCAEPLPESLSPVERLAAVAEAWHTALADGALGGVAKLVFTEAKQFPRLAELWARQAMAPTRATVRDSVTQGIQAGVFRAVEPDIVMQTLVAPLIVSWLHGHVLAGHSGHENRGLDRTQVGCHVDLVLRGLAA